MNDQSIPELHVLYSTPPTVENSQLVNVRVEDPVHKSNAGTLIGVLVGQFDMDLPVAAGEWG